MDGIDTGPSIKQSEEIIGSEEVNAQTSRNSLKARHEAPKAHALKRLQQLDTAHKYEKEPEGAGGEVNSLEVPSIHVTATTAVKDAAHDADIRNTGEASGGASVTGTRNKSSCVDGWVVNAGSLSGGSTGSGGDDLDDFSFCSSHEPVVSSKSTGSAIPFTLSDPTATSHKMQRRNSVLPKGEHKHIETGFAVNAIPGHTWWEAISRNEPDTTEVPVVAPKEELYAEAAEAKLSSDGPVIRSLERVANQLDGLSRRSNITRVATRLDSGVLAMEAAVVKQNALLNINGDSSLRSKMDMILFALRSTVYIPNSNRTSDVEDQSEKVTMAKKLSNALSRTGLAPEDQMSISTRLFAHLSLFDGLRQDLAASAFIRVVRHVCVHAEEWRPYCKQEKLIDFKALKEVLAKSPLTRQSSSFSSLSPSQHMSDEDACSVLRATTADIIQGMNKKGDSLLHDGFHPVHAVSLDNNLHMWLTLSDEVRAHAAVIGGHMLAVVNASDRIAQELFNYCAATELTDNGSGGLQLSSSGIHDALLEGRVAIVTAMSAVLGYTELPETLARPHEIDFDFASLTNLESTDLTDQSQWLNECVDVGLRELVCNFLVLDSLSRALDIYNESGLMATARPENLETWRALRTIRGQLQATLSAVVGYQSTNEALNISAPPKEDLLRRPVMGAIANTAENLPEPADVPTRRFTQRVERDNDFSHAVMEQRSWWRQYRASTSFNDAILIIKGFREADEAQGCIPALAMIDGFYAEICDFYRGDWVLEGELGAPAADRLSTAHDYAEVFDKILQLTHGWRGTAVKHGVEALGLKEREQGCGEGISRVTRVTRSGVTSDVGRQFNTMRAVRIIHTFFYHAVHCGLSGHVSLLTAAGVEPPKHMMFDNFGKELPALFRVNHPDISDAFDQWVELYTDCASVRLAFDTVIRRHGLLADKTTGSTGGLNKDEVSSINSGRGGDGETHGFPIRHKAPLLTTSNPWIWSLRNMTVSQLHEVNKDAAQLSETLESAFEKLNRFMNQRADARRETETSIFLSCAMRDILRQGQVQNQNTLGAGSRRHSIASATPSPQSRRRPSMSHPSRRRSATPADFDSGLDRVDLMVSSLAIEGLSVLPTDGSKGELTWEALTFAKMLVEGLGHVASDYRCISDACTYIGAYSVHFGRFANPLCLAHAPVTVSVLVKMDNTQPGEHYSHEQRETDRNNIFNSRWKALESVRSQVRALLPEDVRGKYSLNDWGEAPESPFLHDFLIDTAAKYSHGKSAVEVDESTRSLIVALNAFRVMVEKPGTELPPDVYFTGRCKGCYTVVGRDGMGNGSAGVAPILAVLGASEVFGYEALLLDKNVASQTDAVMKTVAELLRLEMPRKAGEMQWMKGDGDQYVNTQKEQSPGYYTQWGRQMSDASDPSMWFVDAPEPESVAKARREIAFLLSENHLFGLPSDKLEAPASIPDVDIDAYRAVSDLHYHAQNDIIRADISIYQRFFCPRTRNTILNLAHAFDALLAYETRLYGYLAAFPTATIILEAQEEHDEYASLGDEEVNSDAHQAKKERELSDEATHLRDRLLPTLILDWVKLLPLVDLVSDVVLENGSDLCQLSKSILHRANIDEDMEELEASEGMDVDWFESCLLNIRAIKDAIKLLLAPPSDDDDHGDGGGDDKTGSTSGTVGIAALGRVLVLYVQLNSFLFRVVHGLDAKKDFNACASPDERVNHCRELSGSIAALIEKQVFGAEEVREEGAEIESLVAVLADRRAADPTVHMLFEASTIYAEDLGLVFAPIRQKLLLSLREQEISACVDAIKSIVLSDDIMPAFAFGMVPRGNGCGVDGKVELATEAATVVEMHGVRGKDWSLAPKLYSIFEFLLDGVELTGQSLNAIFENAGANQVDDGVSSLLFTSLRHKDKRLVLPKQRSLYSSPELRRMVTTWRVLCTRLHLSHDGFPATDYLLPSPINPLQMYVDPLVRQRMVDLHVFWQFRLLLQRFKEICHGNSGSMLENSFESQKSTFEESFSVVERGLVQSVLVVEFTDLDALVRQAAYLKDQFLLSNPGDEKSEDSLGDRSILTTAETSYYVDLVYSMFQWRSESLHALIQKDWDQLKVLTARRTIQYFTGVEMDLTQGNVDRFGVSKGAVLLDPLRPGLQVSRNKSNVSLKRAHDALENFRVVSSFCDLVQIIKQHDVDYEALETALGYYSDYNKTFNNIDKDQHAEEIAQQMRAQAHSSAQEQLGGDDEDAVDEQSTWFSFVDTPKVLTLLHSIEMASNTMMERAEKLKGNSAGASFMSVEMTKLIRVAAYVASIVAWLQRRHSKEEDLLHEIRFKELLSQGQDRHGDEDHKIRNKAMEALKMAQASETGDDDVDADPSLGAASVVNRISQAAWRLSRAAPVIEKTKSGGGRRSLFSSFKEIGTSPDDYAPPHIRVEVMRLNRVSENYTMKLNLILVLTEGKGYLDVPLVGEWGKHLSGLLEDCSILSESLPDDHHNHHHLQVQELPPSGRHESRVGNDVTVYIRRLRERIHKECFYSPLSDGAKDLADIESAIAAASSIRKTFRGNKAHSLLESARLVYQIRWAIKHVRWELVKESLESVLPEGETLTLPDIPTDNVDQIESYIRGIVVRYRVVEEAQFELQCVHHIYLAHLYMHQELRRALKEGCVRGVPSRLDISGVNVEPIVRVFERLNRLGFNIVLSVTDCKIAYSARLVAAIRLALVSGNHKNIAEVCRDILLDDLDECVREEVVLCCQASFLVTQLYHCVDLISEVKVQGTVGNVSVRGLLHPTWVLDGPVAGIMKALIVHSNPSPMAEPAMQLGHRSIFNLVSTARAMQDLRLAVKSDLWQAAEVCSFFLEQLLNKDPFVIQPHDTIKGAQHQSSRGSIVSGVGKFSFNAYSFEPCKCTQEVLGLAAQSDDLSKRSSSIYVVRSTEDDVSDMNAHKPIANTVFIPGIMNASLMAIDSEVEGRPTVISAFKALPSLLPQECFDELHLITSELADRVCRIYIESVLRELIEEKLKFITQDVFRTDFFDSDEENEFSSRLNEIEVKCATKQRILRLFGVMWPDSFTFPPGYHPDATVLVSPQGTARQPYPLSKKTLELLLTVRLTSALDEAIEDHSLPRIREALHHIIMERRNVGVDAAISPLVEHAFLCVARHQAIAIFCDGLDIPVCSFRAIVMSPSAVPNIRSTEDGLDPEMGRRGVSLDAEKAMLRGHDESGRLSSQSREEDLIEQLTAMAKLNDSDCDAEAAHNAAFNAGGPTGGSDPAATAPDMIKAFIAGSRLIHEYNIDRVDLTMRLLLHVTEATARLTRAVNSGIRSAVEAAVTRGRDDLKRAKVRIP